MTPFAASLLGRAAALCFALGLRAQEPPAPVPAPEPPTASSLLIKLADPHVPLDDARPIVKALADRPVLIRTQMSDTLGKRYVASLRAFEKARERVARTFGKEVPAVVRTRLGRNGEAKVAALREQARTITDAPDLTKERIHAELDPLLAQLREFVLPTPAQVLEHDETLALAVQSLRSQLDETRGWFELHVAARHDLESDPAGRAHLERQRDEPEPPSLAVVDELLELQCLAGLQLGSRDERTLQANEALRGKLVAEEFAGTLELNKIRIALGLPALLIDEKLGNAARDHATDMKQLGFFAHESPVPGKRSFTDRAARAGTSASGENIAAGQDTGAGAIEAWWYSPGHHKNMLGGHARTGLGRCEHLWTQMFGG
jgi:hypothetical protein